MGLSKREASLLVDAKLLRLMDQLELLEQKRSTLNTLIEQGWFSISKARYSMGNKQVSALQYASEIEPLICVQAKALVTGEVEFCTKAAMQKPHVDNGQDEACVEDIGPKEEGVRRRTKSKRESNTAGISMSTTKVEPPEAAVVTKCERHPQQDPLKWFGILVPQSLKQAQSSFKQVIMLSAEIATLQSAVLNTKEELKLGMKQKCQSQDKISTNQDNLSD